MKLFNKLLAVFFVVSAFGYQSFAQNVARREVLSCENGALKVLAEQGEYGRHQVVITDAGIWRYVTGNYFDLNCKDAQPNQWDSICIGASSELVVPAYINGFYLPKPFTWVNSRESYVLGGRIYQLTVYRDQNLVRLELMSLFASEMVYENGEPVGEKAVPAPKIKLRDWIFHNCAEY